MTAKDNLGFICRCAARQHLKDGPPEI